MRTLSRPWRARHVRAWSIHRRSVSAWSLRAVFVTSAVLACSRTAFGQAVSPQAASITGVVWDSVTTAPLSNTTVHVSRGGSVLAVITTGPDGRYVVHDLTPGTYQVSAMHIGYRMALHGVHIATETGTVEADFHLPTLGVQALSAVSVTAGAPVAVDVHSGNQSYQQQNAHAAPTTTTSQILQSAIAGAARAPTGEVHIRGQHGEYTYYIDGVPVPSSISGSLNELFDPTVVDRINFQTGGWDAEYGDKNIAVVNVTTRVPEGGFHVQASGYTGSFASDGATVVASTHTGKFGILVSGTHQETGMRQEPLMQNPQTGAPLNFHNHGDDDFGFAKLQYTPSDHDRVTLDLNLSSTRFAVPFDSSGGAHLDDHQNDGNGFANLGWLHRFGDVGARDNNDQPMVRELFTGLYMRQGDLRYTPGATDIPQFTFYPDTTLRYTVRENRSAFTTGVIADYTMPLTPAVTIKTGVDASLITGHEDFQTLDSLDRSGPSVNAGLRGGDAGAYVQSVFTPSIHWELRTGLRLDHHVAPVAGDSHQISPRIRLAYFPDAATSMWVYYGRLFIPPNVENLSLLANVAQGGAVGQPTVPERDQYFETGFVHRFEEGIVYKFAGYYRNNSPGVDDNTLPGTALTTDVNLAHVHVTGLESVIEVHPGGVWSGYLNSALSHASAHGPITGGFFPTPYPTGWFDQDHDQRLSILANGEYTPTWGYASLTGIFGSGLTNGRPEAAPNLTGLFDFNPGVKVAPSLIVDASVGTHWMVGTTSVRPEFFVDNLLNRYYILKGAFTSGPSIGRPRSLQLRVTIGH